MRRPLDRDAALTLPELGDWPSLAHLFHITPAMVRLIPEDGGLTWGEVLTFKKALVAHREQQKRDERAARQRRR